MVHTVMPEKRKKPLGGGSPRFRASNRQPDGSYPVLPPKHAVHIDLSEDASAPIDTLVETAAHEAIRHLRWQMRNAPSIRAKERAARQLAAIGAPKPPTRVQTSGPGGGPEQRELHIIFGAD